MTSSASAPIHVVVLAAGRGSRLDALTEASPKWLLEVGGRTIADRHLEGIAAAADVASVLVVTGHAAGRIEDALAGAPLAVATAHVPEHDERNNWWSLLRALRALPANEPVAVVNSDLCVEPDVVAAFLEAAVAAGDPDAGLLAVDVEQAVTDESMKVATDADGRLSAIGKVDVDAPVGEYVGLLAARGAALDALRARLEAFVDVPTAVDEWYEAAVGRTAVADGATWRVWPMPSSDWVEIDDHADLERASALGSPR